MAASWFLPKRPSLAKSLALGVWFLLGAFLIQVRAQRPHAPEPNLALISSLADGRPVTLTAHVIRQGYPRAAGPHSISESIDIETEQIASQGETVALRAGVRLTIYEKVENPESPESVDRRRSTTTPGQRDDAAEAGMELPRTLVVPAPLTYGRRLQTRAKLHPARNYRNPGAFDYERYLRDNGIDVLGSAEGTDIQPLPGFYGSRLELWRTRIHASIVAKIHQLWPASQASLMDAMVLGEESFLHNATRTEYQRSGTYHVLVVSGMNLSILAFSIFWMLRQFRVDPAIAAITTGFIVLTLGSVTG